MEITKKNNRIRMNKVKDKVSEEGNENRIRISVLEVVI